MAADETRKSLLKQSKKKSSKKSFRGLVTGKSKKDKKKSLTESEPEPILEAEAEVEAEAKVETKAAEPQVTQKEAEPVAPIATPKAEETETPPSAAEEEKMAPETKSVEEETVYGAEFDEASKTPTAVVSEAQTKESDSAAFEDPIAIVLLLMDPETRRFELLQLEFDTTKATVADILQQIPISATEESLRTQTFKCVCDTAGHEYDHDKPLSDYVDGNAVVITVPKKDSGSSASAARMARPILTDPKVEEMLRSAGVTIPSIKAPQDDETKSVETSPITITSEATPTPSPPPAEEPVVSKRAVTESAESESSSSFTSLLIVLAVFAYLTRVLVSFQGQTTIPLGPGSTLEPGAWKSKCGLIQANGCDPAYIEMGIDGILQVVKPEGVTFSLVGNVCGEGDDGCVPGAVIEEDGTLKIGGVVPKLEQKSKVPLNPWPFVEGVGPTKGRKAWF